ncbi:hypothetical protein TNCV_1317741 [Trichonephila clavipes]|nr:hypothetical protein TNCV_1317741 [Trichonephila clavipes]
MNSFEKRKYDKQPRLKKEKEVFLPTCPTASPPGRRKTTFSPLSKKPSQLRSTLSGATSLFLPRSVELLLCFSCLSALLVPRSALCRSLLLCFSLFSFTHTEKKRPPGVGSLNAGSPLTDR